MTIPFISPEELAFLQGVSGTLDLPIAGLPPISLVQNSMAASCSTCPSSAPPTRTCPER